MAKDEECGAHVSRCNRAKSEISFLTFFLEILISLLLIVAPACASTHVQGKDLLYKMAKDEECGAHVSRCNRAKSEISFFLIFLFLLLKLSYLCF